MEEGSQSLEGWRGGMEGGSQSLDGWREGCEEGGLEIWKTVKHSG